MNGQDADIENAETALQSLTDISDLSNTAAVEVALDALASAFSKIRKSRFRKRANAPDANLAEVLSPFVEEGLADPVVISLCDEITALFEFKDYEGYNEEYLANRLETLLSDVHDELKETIEKLRA